MTLPANIRVNLGAPFPSLVKGAGPLAIAKRNGVWTVTLQPFSAVAAMPGGTDPATELVLLYNTLTQSFQQTTIANLVAGANKLTNIVFANSPYVPLVTDIFLAVDTAGGAIEIDLPLAALRNNFAISIKDVTGHAAANNVTIKPQPGETVDGYTNAAPLKLNANYDGVRLIPSNASYVIAP